MFCGQAVILVIPEAKSKKTGANTKSKQVFLIISHISSIE